MKRAAIAAAGAALLSACWVPVERGRQMEARIDRLEGESRISAKGLDEQRLVVRERVAQVDAKIVEVQKKIDELNATAHRTGADMAVNQDKLAGEVTRLRGILEEQSHRLDVLDQALAQTKTDSDARFAALKGAGALDEFEARKRLETIARPADKVAFFDLARAQEAKGDRPVARALYEEFVRKWPTDPRAADAHFRLGELWFGEKRHRDAILEYGKVAQNFPRSDKAPDALLRTAESMLEIDLQDDAKALLADVQKRYPSTSAAARAKALLADLTPPPAAQKKKRPAPGKK
ncbi:MAG: tetratricopeptide repeat protein [Anaeromyxobacteraceae bacterium]